MRKQSFVDVRHQVMVFRGPAATVYSCPFCDHVIKIGRQRNPGRGFGLRTGGAAHSQMGSHIRTEHGDLPWFDVFAVDPKLNTTKQVGHIQGKSAPAALLVFFKSRDITANFQQRQYFVRVAGKLVIDAA